MSMNSVLEGLNDRKLADIQDETREIGNSEQSST